MGKGFAAPHFIWTMLNLVLWARSETIGFAYKMEAPNPKHEIRNSKQSPNDQNSNDPNNSSYFGTRFMVCYCLLEHLVFEFVSDFDIRISNLAKAGSSEPGFLTSPHPKTFADLAVPIPKLYQGRVPHFPPALKAMQCCRRGSAFQRENPRSYSHSTRDGPGGES